MTAPTVAPLVAATQCAGCVCWPQGPGGRVLCVRPVAALVVMVCVHEHIREGGQCATHLGRPASCAECYFGAEPHICMLREIDRTSA